MTEETKKLFAIKFFDTPWEIQPCAVGCDVVSSFNSIVEDRVFIAHVDSRETAHILSHLPELYDALMEACGEYCPNLKYDLNYCDNCGGENCKAEKWVELLRKVKEGK